MASFRRLFRLLTWLFFFLLPFGWERGFVATFQVAHAETAESVSESRLAQALAERRSRVPEFGFIVEQAKKLGVRVWLFGGTAAGYSHYVKWDLLREKGDPRFQKDRFDYDYTNIFRSTQDLDIVVDGTPEQAKEFQRHLMEQYPYFEGSKDLWEVRTLRQSLGSKEALLDNPDFLNQHTDSNSTGMIELTEPKYGESVVRDLRDWNSKSPNFLKDVHQGKLHYYLSPLHETTSRAQRGLNPPILSVIRYLTKVFQYELEIKPSDREQIRKIIDGVSSESLSRADGYVRYWIEKNGKKLIQNAVNIEYAVRTLDELGLREKLKNIRKDVKTIDSLSWWMNKSPLTTQKLGEGKGRTAADLFAAKKWSKPGEPLVVAHETNNFLAYESITRAHTGDPNVLISREGYIGEAARYGDGFYTKVGREGARDTGFTIRFVLDPQAREGTDFTYDDDFIVIRNKAALRVIPESLNWSAPDYFRYLAQGDGFASSDKALLEKLKRSVRAKIGLSSETEKKQIAEIVNSALEKGTGFRLELFDEWFSHPASVAFSREKIRMLVSLGYHDAMLDSTLSRYPHWRNSGALQDVFDRKQKFISLSKDEAGARIDKLLKEAFNGSPDPMSADDLSFLSFRHDFRELSLTLGQSMRVPEDALADMIFRLPYKVGDDKDLKTSVVFQRMLKGLSNRPFVSSRIVDLVLRQFDSDAMFGHEVILPLANLFSKPYAKDWEQTRFRMLEHRHFGYAADSFARSIGKHGPISRELFDKLLEVNQGIHQSTDIWHALAGELAKPYTQDAPEWSSARMSFLRKGKVGFGVLAQHIEASFREEGLVSRELFDEILRRAPKQDVLVESWLQSFNRLIPVFARPEAKDWTAQQLVFLEKASTYGDQMEVFVKTLLELGPLKPEVYEALIRSLGTRSFDSQGTRERILKSLLPMLANAEGDRGLADQKLWVEVGRPSGKTLKKFVDEIIVPLGKSSKVDPELLDAVIRRADELDPDSARQVIRALAGAGYAVPEISQLRCKEGLFKVLRSKLRGLW